MTRTLTLLRHAKSAWPEGVADLERPLGERGLRDAPAAGRWLAENVSDLQFVACSTAVRARQTWELASAEFPASVNTGKPEVRHHAKIYYGPLVEVVRDLPAQVTSALLVGHNPDMEDLAEHLSGTPVVFKTSTLAVLRSDLPWTDAGQGWGELVTTATPRGWCPAQGTRTTPIEGH